MYMNTFYNTNTPLHLQDNYQRAELSRKWGISARALNEAILSTGTIQPQALRQYLKERALLPSLLVRVWQNLKDRFFIH
jgi:hypothetical protein